MNCRMAQNRVPESRIDIGRVRTHAVIMLRTVVQRSPDLLAAIVPAARLLAVGLAQRTDVVDRSFPRNE